MSSFTRYLAILVVLLYGCSGTIDDDNSPVEIPVPIRIATLENKLSTRAVVNTIDATVAQNIGIYAVKEGTTSGQFPWTTSPYYANIAPSGISGTLLSFSSKLYYPLGGKRVKFFAYYPRTTATSGNNYITAPGNGTPPIFNFTLTGAEDIMYAASSPSGSSSPATVAFTFTHALTQLQISTASLLGSLSSITLMNVQTQGNLNLDTGVVTLNSGTANLNILGLLSNKVATVMVPANLPSYKVQVALLGLLPTTYTIKPPSGNFLPGMMYTITL